MRENKTKIKLSRRLLLAVSIMFISVSVMAQKDTYEIINEAGVSNIADYKASMNDANFDSYRYINKNRRITFESGVVIELYSVNTLKQRGVPVNELRASTYNPNNVKSKGVWKLLPNGYIVQELESNTKKSK